MIKDTYWAWMEWAVRAARASWIDLRDSVIRRAIDPSPLVDLAKLISERENSSAEDREHETARLSIDDRRRILDNYFSQSYRVAPGVNH